MFNKYEKHITIRDKKGNTQRSNSLNIKSKSTNMEIFNLSNKDFNNTSLIGIKEILMFFFIVFCCHNMKINRNSSKRVKRSQYTKKNLTMNPILKSDIVSKNTTYGIHRTNVNSGKDNTRHSKQNSQFASPNYNTYNPSFNICHSVKDCVNEDLELYSSSKNNEDMFNRQKASSVNDYTIRKTDSGLYIIKYTSGLQLVIAHCDGPINAYEMHVEVRAGSIDEQSLLDNATRKNSMLGEQYNNLKSWFSSTKTTSENNETQSIKSGNSENISMESINNKNICQSPYSGVAHLLEHICFLGSSKRTEILAGSGATSNAYTDFHHTVYHLGVPLNLKTTVSESIQSGATVLSDIVLSPRFTKDRLNAEKAAVISEIIEMESLEYMHELSIMKMTHGENSPYFRRLPVGHIEEVQNVKLTDIERFYNMHYNLNNMCIFFAGDLKKIDINDIINSINSEFNLSDKGRKRKTSSSAKVICDELTDFGDISLPTEDTLEKAVDSFWKDLKYIPIQLSDSILDNALIFAKRTPLPQVLINEIPLLGSSTTDYKIFRHIALLGVMDRLMNVSSNNIQFTVQDQPGENSTIHSLELQGNEEQVKQLSYGAISELKRLYQDGFNKESILSSLNLLKTELEIQMSSGPSRKALVDELVQSFRINEEWVSSEMILRRVEELISLCKSNEKITSDIRNAVYSVPASTILTLPPKDIDNTQYDCLESSPEVFLTLLNTASLGTPVGTAEVRIRALDSEAIPTITENFSALVTGVMNDIGSIENYSRHDLTKLVFSKLFHVYCRNTVLGNEIVIEAPRFHIPSAVQVGVALAATSSVGELELENYIKRLLRSQDQLDSGLEKCLEDEIMSTSFEDSRILNIDAKKYLNLSNTEYIRRARYRKIEVDVVGNFDGIENPIQGIEKELSKNGIHIHIDNEASLNIRSEGIKIPGLAFKKGTKKIKIESSQSHSRAACSSIGKHIISNNIPISRIPVNIAADIQAMRLYQRMRDDLGLVYHVGFDMIGVNPESFSPEYNYWMSSFTTTPNKLCEATSVMNKVLEKGGDVQWWELKSAKQNMIRHLKEASSMNTYWLDWISSQKGLGLPCNIMEAEESLHRDSQIVEQYSTKSADQEIISISESAEHNSYCVEVLN